jgi:hypothetical protein
MKTKTLNTDNSPTARAAQAIKSELSIRLLAESCGSNKEPISENEIADIIERETGLNELLESFSEILREIKSAIERRSLGHRVINNVAKRRAYDAVEKATAGSVLTPATNLADHV